MSVDFNPISFYYFLDNFFIDISYYFSIWDVYFSSLYHKIVSDRYTFRHQLFSKKWALIWFIDFDQYYLFDYLVSDFVYYEKWGRWYQIDPLNAHKRKYKLPLYWHFYKKCCLGWLEKLRYRHRFNGKWVRFFVYITLNKDKLALLNNLYWWDHLHLVYLYWTKFKMFLPFLKTYYWYGYIVPHMYGKWLYIYRNHSWTTTFFYYRFVWSYRWFLLHGYDYICYHVLTYFYGTGYFRYACYFVRYLFSLKLWIIDISHELFFWSYKGPIKLFQAFVATIVGFFQWNFYTYIWAESVMPYLVLVDLNRYLLFYLRIIYLLIICFWKTIFFGFFYEIYFKIASILMFFDLYKDGSYFFLFEILRIMFSKLKYLYVYFCDFQHSMLGEDILSYKGFLGKPRFLNNHVFVLRNIVFSEGPMKSFTFTPPYDYQFRKLYYVRSKGLTFDLFLAGTGSARMHYFTVLIYVFFFAFSYYLLFLFFIFIFFYSFRMAVKEDFYVDSPFYVWERLFTQKSPDVLHGTLTMGDYLWLKSDRFMIDFHFYKDKYFKDDIFFNIYGAHLDYTNVTFEQFLKVKVAIGYDIKEHLERNLLNGSFKDYTDYNYLQVSNQLNLPYIINMFYINRYAKFFNTFKFAVMEEVNELNEIKHWIFSHRRFIFPSAVDMDADSSVYNKTTIGLMYGDYGLYYYEFFLNVFRAYPTLIFDGLKKESSDPAYQYFKQLEKSLFRAFEVYKSNGKEMNFDFWEYQYFAPIFFNELMMNYSQPTEYNVNNVPLIHRIGKSRAWFELSYVEPQDSSLNLTWYPGIWHNIEYFLKYLRHFNYEYFSSFFSIDFTHITNSRREVRTNIDVDFLIKTIDLLNNKIPAGISYSKVEHLEDAGVDLQEALLASFLKSYFKKVSNSDLDLVGLEEDQEDQNVPVVIWLGMYLWIPFGMIMPWFVESYASDLFAQYYSDLFIFGLFVEFGRRFIGYHHVLESIYYNPIFFLETHYYLHPMRMPEAYWRPFNIDYVSLEHHGKWYFRQRGRWCHHRHWRFMTDKWRYATIFICQQNDYHVMSYELYLYELFFNKNFYEYSILFIPYFCFFSFFILFFFWFFENLFCFYNVISNLYKYVEVEDVIEREKVEKEITANYVKLDLNNINNYSIYYATKRKEIEKWRIDEEGS